MHVRMPVFAIFFYDQKQDEYGNWKVVFRWNYIFQMAFSDLIHMQHIQSPITHVKLVEFVFPFSV